MRAPLAIIPAELEYFTELPRMLGDAGFAVRQADGPDALNSVISDADVMLASAFLGVNREQLTAANRLRGVISLIIGVDNVDVQACTDLGIIVGNGAVPGLRPMRTLRFTSTNLPRPSAPAATARLETRRTWCGGRPWELSASGASAERSPSAFKAGMSTSWGAVRT